MPDEIMGVVPNSINVPLLLASIILSQYSGSELSDETMPYNGIWLMIKKISSVNCPYRQHCSALLVPLKVPHPSPHELLVEWCFGLWRCDLGQQRSEGFYEVEKAYYGIYVSDCYLNLWGVESDGDVRPLMIAGAPQCGLESRSRGKRPGRCIHARGEAQPPFVRFLDGDLFSNGK